MNYFTQSISCFPSFFKTLSFSFLKTVGPSSYSLRNQAQGRSGREFEQQGEIWDQGERLSIRDRIGVEWRWRREMVRVGAEVGTTGGCLHLETLDP